MIPSRKIRKSRFAITFCYPTPLSRTLTSPPTSSTANDGKWEDDDFRARDATTLVEISSKPKVIENAIKSQSKTNEF